MNTENPQFDTLSKVFSDADAAREFLEAIRWPDGPVCPHCGVEGRAYKLEPKEGSKRPVRPGVYKCADCRKQFTVTVGTIFEGTRVPLNKWIYVIQLMTAAKKGVSAHQVHRTIKVTYKTAWFMCHRIRKAMECEPLAGLLGGGGGIVEADETYVGGKPRRQNRTADGEKTTKTEKAIVFAAVERGGKARSRVVGDSTAETLQGALVDDVSLDTHVMTDGHRSYKGLSSFFDCHSSVDHDKEYVNGIIHTNTAESLFSLFKRGIFGAFHHVSKKHLHRYLAEFDFRWNHREVEDGERLVAAIEQTGGKRLMYRKPAATTA